jgi:hypothetical protein
LRLSICKSGERRFLNSTKFKSECESNEIAGAARTSPGVAATCRGGALSGMHLVVDPPHAAPLSREPSDVWPFAFGGIKSVMLRH